MTTDRIIPDAIPVTILTGFLGAGKTTLLNRILTEEHGKKYAVIINEFGEVGIDNDLVAHTDEEIFEMNNGCICCTVRGDLIRIIGSLLRRGKAFDGIIVETTGLADPGPVVQSFFADDTLAKRTKLDAVVTLVDAMHFETSLTEGHEAAEQIAFADIIVLNKTDLADEAQLAHLESRIHSMNPLAPIIRTQRSEVALDNILGIGAFDLARITAMEPDFLKTGHHHTHNEAVGSVALKLEKPLDPQKFDAWIGDLSQTKGPDLLRYKGILNLKGMDRRFVLQGVHMIMDGQPTQAWLPDEDRTSRLVFIGKNLDEAALAQGFESCVA